MIEEHWDLRRLSIFRTVATEGSLTKASVSLGLPQPAISRQIAKFEGECGGRLFQRTGRGVQLTELGERVFTIVELVVKDTQALTSEVEGKAQTASGEVRLATLPSLYQSLVIPLFFKLRQLHPAILLHVFEGSAGQIDQWLVSGFIDIGLPYRYGSRFSSDVHPLVTVPSCLIGAAGDKVTREETVRFDQIHNLPLVLPSASSSVRLHLRHLAKEAGITLNVVIEADSTQLQTRIARERGGYTVLPPHSVAEDLAAGRVQASRIVSPEINRTIVLGISPARASTLAIREVTKHVRLMMGQTSMIDHLRGTVPVVGLPE
ncbi:LysR family transcriptional regulator [soil metagenome]